jgi:hypothetical protein
VTAAHSENFELLEHLVRVCCDVSDVHSLLVVFQVGSVQTELPTHRIGIWDAGLTADQRKTAERWWNVVVSFLISV